MDWLLSIFGFSSTVSLDPSAQDQAFEKAAAVTMTNDQKICILHPNDTRTSEDDQGPRRLCNRRQDGQQSSAVSTGSPVSPQRTPQATATPSLPSHRSPPNSPARPIGPPEEWYLASSSSGTSQTGHPHPHPHPLRSHPTSSPTSPPKPLLARHHSPCRGHSLPGHIDMRGGSGGDEVKPVSDKEERLRFGALNIAGTVQNAEQQLGQYGSAPDEYREGMASVGGPESKIGGGVVHGADAGADADNGVSADDRGNGSRIQSQEDGGGGGQARKSETTVEAGEREWRKDASGLGPGEAWYA